MIAYDLNHDIQSKALKKASGMPMTIIYKQFVKAEQAKKACREQRNL